MKREDEKVIEESITLLSKYYDEIKVLRTLTKLLEISVWMDKDTFPVKYILGIKREHSFMGFLEITKSEYELFKIWLGRNYGMSV